MKGDEIDITIAGNHLVIAPQNDETPLTHHVSVDISNLDRSSIMYTVRGMYRRGYDEIELEFTNTTTSHLRPNKEVNVLSVIHEEVNRLIGVEIIQQREHSCVIKSISEVTTKDFETLLRRIFLLLNDASSDLLAAISKNDHILLETIEEKHNTVTKFISYCLRLLNKKGHPDLKNPSIHYHIIATLDKIMDNIKYAGRDFRNLSRQMSPAGIKIVECIHNSLIWYYDFFYKFDASYITKLYKNRDAVRKMLHEGTLSPGELVSISLLSSILELLVDITEARVSLQY